MAQTHTAEMFSSGKMQEKEWFSFLKSNHGLFKKYKGKSPVLGPKLHLDPKSGAKIIGDMGAMEITSFTQHADRGQMKFFMDLEKIDPTRAREYEFVIDGSLKVWREDIKILEEALQIFQAERDTLQGEKRKIDRMIYSKLDRLKRLIPGIENELSIHIREANTGIDHDLDRINHIIKEIKKELDKLKQNMPILFNKSVH